MLDAAQSTLVPPPAVAYIRDLVNTVEWQLDDETWGTPADLQKWLAERGAEELDDVSNEDLVLARRIREGLREVLLTHAGHEARSSAIDDLNEAVSRIPLRLAFEVEGRSLLTVSGDRRPHPLAPIIQAVDAARCDAAWPRLKACSRDTCRWAYFDASRNASARWCSMAGCGNYVKMRRRNTRGRDDGVVIPPAGGSSRRATLLDVASRAGVSMKTVSNVVNGAGHVAESTRTRVQQAIDELEYRPNLAARALRNGGSV